jgi:hypothetical protein
MPLAQAQAYSRAPSPFGINPAGAIVGYYFDAGYVFHGFLEQGE